jgi:alpha-beta hydrolase superfamily lysophospholipase
MDMNEPLFRRDSFLLTPTSRSQDEALDQAMLRAYSIERSVDYGCALEDVLKLRRRVEAGHGWADVALQLADDNEHRAGVARDFGDSALAGRYLGYAAACCRLAQAGLEHDTTLRLQAYERQADLFRRAMETTPSSGAECFTVVHRGAPHAVWLFRAEGSASGCPVVLVWGGADGWCEAFSGSVPFYLACGLSVCLLELPGQGLARLRHGSVLAPDFTTLVSKTLDALVDRGLAPDRMGVVGHSAGGSLALAAADADSRIAACCSNGGSPQLLKGLQKYPRVAQRFGRMLGDQHTDADTRAFFEEVDLEGAARRMSAQLLCLHGGLDTLVDDREAQHLIDLHGPEQSRLEYWPEGVHCLYNHAVERNSVLARWFATQLA